jgi:hypothetical protein
MLWRSLPQVHQAASGCFRPLRSTWAVSRSSSSGAVCMDTGSFALSATLPRNPSWLQVRFPASRSGSAPSKSKRGIRLARLSAPHHIDGALFARSAMNYAKPRRSCRGLIARTGFCCSWLPTGYQFRPVSLRLFAPRRTSVRAGMCSGGRRAGSGNDKNVSATDFRPDSPL